MKETASHGMIRKREVQAESKLAQSPKEGSSLVSLRQRKGKCFWNVKSQEESKGDEKGEKSKALYVRGDFKVRLKYRYLED